MDVSVWNQLQSVFKSSGADENVNDSTDLRKWGRQCCNRSPDARCPCTQTRDSASDEMNEFNDSSVYKRLNGCCIGLRLMLHSDVKPSACKWELVSLDLQLILRHDIRSRLFFAKSVCEKTLLNRLKEQAELPSEQVMCIDFLSLDHLPNVESNDEIKCLMVNVATSSQVSFQR